MTLAAIGWELFSVRALLVLLIAGAVWLWARRESPAARRFLFFVIAAYSIAAYAPLAVGLSRWLSAGFHPLTREDVPAGRTAIVLLGAGSYMRAGWFGTSASVLDGIGVERTMEAARVYHMLDAACVISSGGAPDPITGESSGQTMKDLLVRLGVPADRVVVEDRSANTRDEAVIVAGMLPPLHVDHVILVTSQLHMRRSLNVFRANGIQGIPAVSRDSMEIAWPSYFLPSGFGLEQSSRVAHEIVGLGYYWLRGDFRSAAPPAPAR